MKKFERPMIVVTRFTSEDIVKTSGTAVGAAKEWLGTGEKNIVIFEKQD